MYKLLDIENWNRRPHFDFFKTFEEPFFSVTVNVNCTKAYIHAKELGISFFLYYLFLSLKAANQTVPFRYRIKGDAIFIYDQINASATINRPDGTFGFSYIDYQDNIDDFITVARKEIARIENTRGLIPSASAGNVIHYSAIPWINFTSLSHARKFSFKDSCPKISFGKITENNHQKLMPLSVTVHHGLMDGLHVGEYIDLFQQLLNEGA